MFLSGKLLGVISHPLLQLNKWCPLLSARASGVGGCYSVTQSSHSQHVEQCSWYSCLIKHAEDVVTELEFSSMGLDSVSTHSFSCHAETLLNETFVPFSFMMLRLVSFPTYHCILLLNIYLWFQVGFLMWLEYFLFFFSDKELPGRSSIPRPHPDCLKRGQKPSIVQLVIQALALVKGQCHSPQKGKGSVPWIDRFLFPPH